MSLIARLNPFHHEPTPEQLDGVPGLLNHEFYRNPKSDELIVVLSPAGKVARYVADKRRRSALYLGDPRFNYYTRGAPQMARRINQLIKDEGIRKTLFIGGSKAGYGALLLIALCARGAPDHPFRCLAFSPHSLLWPENPNLTIFVTYRNLMTRASRDPKVRAALDKFGDARLCQDLPNTHIIVFYGENFRRDRDEALRLSGANIRHFPLPIGFHNTQTPFLIRDSTPAHVKQTCERIFTVMQKHEETRLSIPPTPEELINEVQALKWLPSMKEVIEDVMAV